MHSPPNQTSTIVNDRKPSDADDFRHLAEALPQIVWTANPEGELEYINPQFAEFSGLSKDDPDFSNWILLVHDEDRDATIEAWKNALATGGTYEKEIRLRAADGRYQWFAARAKPVIGPDGAIVRWYGITSNIDDLKRAERALTQAASAKDKFIAMLGHELRNPLSALSGSYQNLIHSEIGDEGRAEVLESLGRQISHLSRLVDDTLDISRLSSGKLRLISSKLELNQLVESCGSDFSHRCADNDVSVIIQQSREPIWLEGDSVRISQCVNNILSNALKFTRPGGKIVVACGINPQSALAEITITDDGIGMTKKELNTIFQPFTQGRNAGRLSSEGLGLGLAITQEILELHKGNISVFSAGRGTGSTFVLRLPTCAAPADSGEAETEEKIGKRLSGLKILLVDDDKSVASMLEMFLQLEGHIVTVASCGSSALAALDQGLPEILFCDLTLPGSIKGWDIAQRIRESYPENQMPYMVALSGYSDEYHIGKSLASGFDEHLAKPPSLEQLRAALQRAF